MESLRRNGNCDETNGAVSHTCKMIHVVQMFENVTTQTRDDAQGNWHNPVHDMLRGSIALDKLRYMAVADVAAREFSQLQKELLSSMPVTKQLLRIPVPPESYAVEAVYEHSKLAIKNFSTTGSPRQFGFLPDSVLAIQG